ncbi:MAG: DUF4168 domain-containing protein [Oscillatoriales cyanobacterium]|nr:MAG: DUF4168 domain-containing protein [Oscillatoriales cyanobacterium]
MNTLISTSKFRLNRMLRQSLFAGIISAAALASGWAEPRREEAMKEIKGMAGGSVPRIVCNETQGINSLSGGMRGVAVNYCQQAKKIIETNGLTVSRFNQLTLLQQRDPAVKQRIQAELLRLQQAGNQ